MWLRGCVDYDEFGGRVGLGYQVTRGGITGQSDFKLGVVWGDGTMEALLLKQKFHMPVVNG